MKKVIISVKGTQEYPKDEPEKMELVTEGEYSLDGGIAVFRYQESELTGLAGTTTTFRLENGDVTLTREGAVTTQMIFSEGKKHYFAYETPYGSMTMGIDTSSIYSRLRKSGGDLEIRYNIDAANSIISKNTFNINIREAGR